MTTVSHVMQRVRQVALPLSAVVGVYVFAKVVQPIYPIEKWLFWRYLSYWLATLFWCGACVSAGDAVVRRLAPHLGASERLLTDFTVGVVLFVTGVCVGGVLRLFGPTFFFALPALMVVSGGRPFLAFVKRLHLHRARWLWPRPDALGWLITLFGLGCLALIYFQVLTPENATADAHWYHLAVPERYAAQGRIAKYPEGWYMGALPQLASLVYTWGFLFPGGDLFDRVELSAHLEFAILLWTLFGIPVLVRWALGPLRRLGVRAGAAGAWAAMLLFPSLFLYDSSLGMAADHVSALWVIPMVLGLRRMHRSMSAQSGALFAIPVAAALTTKYQAMVVVLLPIGVFGLRTLYVALRPSASKAERLNALYTALACMGAALAASAVHWFKNLVFYGDPLFPFLHRHFTPHPWSATAQHLFENWFLKTQTAPVTGTPVEALKQTIEALFTFSFVPHDYEHFHGKTPTFGSLFTLATLPLVFLRRSGRIWSIAIVAYVGVGLWFAVSHWDRYLQVLVPLMAAVVAAVVAAMWASGIASRVAVSLLVGFQIVWGGDVPFFPNHGMMGQNPAKRAIDLLSSGFRNDFKMRTHLWGLADIEASLPKDATVLVHDMNGAFGIQRPTVSDVMMWQSGIDYGSISSPRAIYQKLREYGVTHLLWRPGTTGFDSLAGDIAFYGFVARYLEQSFASNGYVVSPLVPDRVPVEPWLDSPVAVFVCSESYLPGVYRLRDLAVPSAEPRIYPAPREPMVPNSDPMLLAQRSEFIAWEPRCGQSLDMARLPTFVKAATRPGGIELWVRK